MKNLFRLLTVTVLAALSFAAFSSPASAQKTYGKTAIFNLTQETKVKPSRFFLTANSGPYLKKLKWSKWGTAKTVGRGRFISDCVSCGEKENKPVRMTLHELIPCPKYKVMTYKFAKIKVVDPERPNRVQKFRLGCAL